MREVTLEKSTHGNTMYQIDYLYICLQQAVRQNLHLFSQMYMLLITVYIKLCMNTQNLRKCKYIVMCYSLQDSERVLNTSEQLPQ